MSDIARPDLCWFCGRGGQRPLRRGYAVGSMIYTSDIVVSSDMTPTDDDDIPDMPQHVVDHSLKDGVQICSDCLGRFDSQVGELSPSYVKGHQARREEQFCDIADVDTFLKPWNEVIHPFGCWLGGYPEVGVNQRFYSLELAELFDRGLRFCGNVTVDADPFFWFLNRFATGAHRGSPSFFEHANRHVQMPGRPLPDDFAKVRAVVFDVSVWLAVQRDTA